MAGTALTHQGDVQVGTDNAYLLCASSVHGFNPANYVRALQFNPWVWPDISSDDTAYWHRSGMKPGADIPTSRRIEFTIDINQPDAASLNAKLAQLAAATKPVFVAGVEQEVSFMFGSTKYVLYGRYREVDVIDTSLVGKYSVQVRVRFTATDPIIYEATPTVVTVPVWTGTLANWHINYASHISFLSGGASTAIDIGGDAPPRWAVTINGPARNPVLVNTTTAKWLWLAYPAGYTVASTLSVVVTWHNRDIRTGTGFSAGEYHAYPSHWFEMNNMPVTNKLVVAVDNSHTGSASMPGGTPVASSLAYQVGWWVMPS